MVLLVLCLGAISFQYPFNVCKNQYPLVSRGYLEYIYRAGLETIDISSYRIYIALNMTTEPEPPTKGTLFPEQTNRVIVPATADTIRTKRLILRPLALTDAEDLFEHRRRQDVADWL